jgi:hypothetical protein
MTVRDIILQVALLHLARHALAKDDLFLTAAGVCIATGSYLIRLSALAMRTSWVFGESAGLALTTAVAWATPIGALGIDSPSTSILA